MIEIRPISARDTLAIRWPVLRAGLPREAAIFEGDDLPATRHLGVWKEGRLIGVASLLRSAVPGSVDPGIAWQLRGMAMLPEARNQGYGGALLAACEAAAREAGGTFCWCNARKGAVPFYTRHGWQTLGEEFKIPTAGPHFQMRKLFSNKPSPSCSLR